MNSKLDQLAQQLLELQTKEIIELIKLISSKCDLDLLAMMQDTPAASQAETEEVSDAAQKPKLYDVKLVGFAPEKKAEIIKNMRTILGGSVSLSDVKSKVEALPVLIKKSVKEEEMKETKELFENIGGKLEISES